MCHAGSIAAPLSLPRFRCPAFVVLRFVSCFCLWTLVLLSKPPLGSRASALKRGTSGEILTPSAMADISATHNSEKLANPITDSSGDPVTLDDNPAHVAGMVG